MIFRTKVGDTRSAIKATLLSSAGSPVNLAGCKVRFKMDCIMDREITVTDTSAGKVIVMFQADDVAKPGIYLAEIKVEYPDGRIETFPNSGYIIVYIEGGVCE